MVFRLHIERSGFQSWPGTLCCVLGQDSRTVLLSTQVYNWVRSNLTVGRGGVWRVEVTLTDVEILPSRLIDWLVCRFSL